MEIENHEIKNIYNLDFNNFNLNKKIKEYLSTSNLSNINTLLNKINEQFKLYLNEFKNFNYLNYDVENHNTYITNLNNNYIFNINFTYENDIPNLYINVKHKFNNYNYHLSIHDIDINNYTI
jgi:hypothetical protein